MLYDFINLQRKDFPFARRVIFEKRNLYLAYCATIAPVDFHILEDGKLIIQGAKTANSTADGLYLDCVPDG